MLTLAFGRAVILVLLYFTTQCLSRTLHFRDNETFGKKFVDSSQTNIQKCGAQLTSFITSLCDGYFSSPSEDYGSANGTRNVPTGVVEKCCKNPCKREYLMQHCGEKSNLKAMLQPKWEGPESINDLTNIIDESTNPPLEAELGMAAGDGGGSSEVRKGNIPKVGLKDGNERGRKKNRKNGKRGRRRRKPLSKWDRAYKSFGHYLLTLDHNVNVPNKIRKRKNVPPQEVGTIKPDNLGGDPFIMRTRHVSSRKFSSNWISRSKSIVARYNK